MSKLQKNILRIIIFVVCFACIVLASPERFFSELKALGTNANANDEIITEAEGEDVALESIVPEITYSVNFYYENNEGEYVVEEELAETRTVEDNSYVGLTLNDMTPTKVGYAFNKEKTFSETGSNKFTVSEGDTINVYFSLGENLESPDYNYIIHYFMNGESIDDEVSDKYREGTGKENQIVEYKKYSRFSGLNCIIDTEKSTDWLEISSTGDNVFYIYYVTVRDYSTVEYYYDGVLDSSKTREDITVVTNREYTESDFGQKEGYEFSEWNLSSHTNNITGEQENTLKFYFVRIAYQYKIEYYYDGELDENETVTGTELYNEVVGYTEKNRTGFARVDREPEDGQITIGINEDENIIRVYYERQEYPYTIEYWYGGVRDNSKTVTGQRLYNEELDYLEFTDETKEKDGYEFSNTNPENGKITISTNSYENVIKVNYAKKSYGYTINYYYDGQLDETQTINGTALFLDTINYTNKPRDGYYIDNIAPENGRIVIGTNAEENVINVYYERDLFDYTVEYYYDGIIDKTKTVTGTRKFNEELSYTEFTDETKEKIGYEFSNTNPESGSITIGSNPVNNIIRVYYIPGLYDYRIEYYYDGIIDDEKTVTGKANYGSKINYEDFTDDSKTRDGYYIDNVTPAKTMTIGINAEENVIKVYYEKNSYNYTVKYYYDGKVDNSKTVNGSAKYQDEIVYEDKVIEGYHLDKVEPEVGKITIGTNPNENIIEVYYEKSSYGYIIEYYFEDKLEKTETGTALYGEKVEYTPMDREGYSIDPTYPTFTIISVNEEENKIEVHYERNSYNYRIEYYYDGKIDNSKTVIDSEKYGEQVNYLDYNLDDSKEKEGYHFDSVTAKTITIGINAEENIIKVYYEKNSYNYKIEYYFDGELENTEKNTAKYQDVISYDETQIRKGYELSELNPTSGSITIGINEEENVLKVYYTKVKSQVIVEYIDVETKEKLFTYTIPGEYGTPYTTSPMIFEGYKLAENGVPANQGGTLGEEIQTVTYLYEKDSFDYTVKYYYDGKVDNNETVKGTAKFKDTISYEDKIREGYKLDEVSPVEGSIKISANPLLNVIEVYYTRVETQVVVEFVNSETGAKFDSYTLDGKYGDLYATTPKDIEGYKLTENGVPANANGTFTKENQKVTYLYERDSFGYTINYYYAGELDESKTVNGTAKYQDAIKYTAQPKEGYELSKVTPNDGSIKVGVNSSENVIDVYYTKVGSRVVVRYVDSETNKEFTSYTIDGEFGDEYKTEAKEFTGYKLTESGVPANANGTLQATSQTVTYLYERDSFGYTINYYYAGELDESKTVTGTAKYQDTIKYTAQDKEGYKLNNVAPVSGSISIGVKPEENVINVYYIKVKSQVIVKYIDSETGKEFDSYTIDGEFNDEYKTEVKEFTGYKLTENGVPANANGTLQATSQTVTYLYERDSFGYTINYYYADELDESKTITGTAKYQDIVKYEDKVIEGYELSKVTPDDGSIKVGVNPSENVINVYYTKVKTQIVVEYVDSETNTVFDSYTIDGEYGDLYETKAKDIEGYKLTEKGNPENSNGTFTVENQKVTYLYERDSFEYKIIYHYPVEKDVTEEVVGTELFNNEIKYEPKDKDGYKLSKVEPEEGSIKISANPEENIINVYYERIPYEYSIEYYYDGQIDEEKTEYGFDLYLNKINSYEEKLIEGYKFDHMSPVDGIVIGLDKEENVLKVYYEKVECKVNVQYVDKATGKVLDSYVIEGKYGDIYTTKAKSIEGYNVAANGVPENAAGVMEEKEITVTYQYEVTKKPNAVSQIVTSVKTGDTYPIFVISMILVLIVSNIGLTVFSKKEDK